MGEAVPQGALVVIKEVMALESLTQVFSVRSVSVRASMMQLLLRALLVRLASRGRH